jgi:hypothetical protein
VLVDEDDADVLALRGEVLESSLDGGRLRLVVDYEEVLLRVGRVRDMLCVAASRLAICTTTAPLMQREIALHPRGGVVGTSRLRASVDPLHGGREGELDLRQYRPAGGR